MLNHGITIIAWTIKIGNRVLSGKGSKGKLVKRFMAPVRVARKLPVNGPGSENESNTTVW